MFQGAHRQMDALMWGRRRRDREMMMKQKIKRGRKRGNGLSRQIASIVLT